MKKIALVLFMAAGLLSAAVAQETVAEASSSANAVAESSPMKGWTFGLVGGWDENTPVITMPGYASNMEYRKASGATFGLSAKYAFTNWLYGRADVVMVKKNYEINRTGYSEANFLNTAVTTSYLNVPVMAMVSFGYEFRIFGYAGGYVGYWMSGHRKGEAFSLNYLLNGDKESTKFDQDWEFDDRRDNRFDAGLVFGGGISVLIAKHFEVSAEGRWYLGQTDVQKDYMVNRTPHYNTTIALQAGVAYKF